VEHELSIRFYDRLVKYEFGELDEVSRAYAVTTHESRPVALMICMRLSLRSAAFVVAAINAK
jgi:hypothetical protein